MRVLRSSHSGVERNMAPHSTHSHHNVRPHLCWVCPHF
jgi:hypothetical protein